jgi:hypothetical protein
MPQKQENLSTMNERNRNLADEEMPINDRENLIK